MLSEKAMIIQLIIGLIKKMPWVNIFLKYINILGKCQSWIRSQYATKADFKGAIGANTSNVAAKSDLASLRAEVDR